MSTQVVSCHSACHHLLIVITRALFLKKKTDFSDFGSKFWEKQTSRSNFLIFFILEVGQPAPPPRTEIFSRCVVSKNGDFLTNRHILILVKCKKFQYGNGSSKFHYIHTTR